MRHLWRAHLAIWFQCAAAWSAATPPAGHTDSATALQQYVERSIEEGPKTYEGALQHWPLPIYIDTVPRKNTLVLRQQPSGTYRAAFYEGTIGAGDDKRWIVQPIDERGLVAPSAQVGMPAEGQYFIQVSWMEASGKRLAVGDWVRMRAESGFALGTLMGVFATPGAGEAAARGAKAWVRIMYLNGALAYGDVRYHVFDTKDIEPAAEPLPWMRVMRGPSPSGAALPAKNTFVSAGDLLRELIRRRLRIAGTFEQIRAEEAPLGSAATGHFDGKLVILRTDESAAVAIVSNRSTAAELKPGIFYSNKIWFDRAGVLQHVLPHVTGGMTLLGEIAQAKVAAKSGDWIAKNNQWVWVKNPSNFAWLGNIAAIFDGYRPFSSIAWIRILLKQGRRLPIDEVEYVLVPIEFLTPVSSQLVLEAYPDDRH